jgi:uncharacterized membrane protein YGL010W
VLFYALYYASLEFFAGVTWAACVGVPLRLTSRAFQAKYAREGAGWWGLVAHIVGWTLQIYPGHAVWEKRKPAILDSIFQSIVLAPLFVHVEALFWLGYRPGLREDLKRRIERRIAEMDEGKNAAAAKND